MLSDPYKTKKLKKQKQKSWKIGRISAKKFFFLQKFLFLWCSVEKNSKHLTKIFTFQNLLILTGTGIDTANAYTY
jgi:hypothetical protein